MLAHELRNPLAPIIHAINLLRRADAGGSAQHLHEMIERQTKRLSRLVDELLDMARFNRGMVDVKREPIDLTTVTRDAVESIAPRIEQFGHSLSLSLPDVPVHVDGDAVRLEQVITNLLENAAKYTEPGGRITVTLAEVNEEAVLSVRDSGVGLAPETINRIFDTFVQVGPSLARERGGLGLGLSVVRRVLDLHGGRIEVHSEGLGHGSEFRVRLPLLGRPSLAAATGPVVTQPDRGAAHARRVLIVDDNHDFAVSLKMLAELWGHDVAVASDGRSALELAAGFKPEYALIDIGLPGMDGYELARRLSDDSRYGTPYLVALTGYGRDEDLAAARAAGFAEHLVKPADLETLEQMLAK